MSIEKSEYVRGAIAWHDPEEGEGGCVGEISSTKEDAERRLKKATEKSPPDRDAIEAFTVEIAMHEFVASLRADLVRREKLGAWIFEQTRELKMALQIARSALKSSASSVPWPAWAIAASAAGWKPPKGWKP